MEPTPNPMPTTVIAIAGFAGAGKDTLAKAIEWHIKVDCSTVKFADELKNAINLSLDYLGLEPLAFTEDRAKKEKLRPLMKDLGVYARSQDIDIFAKIGAGTVENRGKQKPVVFVTDLRYANEYKALSELCERNGWRFVAFYVCTNGVGPANEEEAQSLAKLLEFANGRINLMTGIERGDFGRFDFVARHFAEHFREVERNLATL